MPADTEQVEHTADKKRLHVEDPVVCPNVKQDVIRYSIKETVDAAPERKSLRLQEKAEKKRLEELKRPAASAGDVKDSAGKSRRKDPLPKKVENDKRMFNPNGAQVDDALMDLWKNKKVKKEIRCGPTTEQTINIQIQATREEAEKNEKHMLVLLKDMQFIEPRGYLLEVPQAPYQSRLFGYSICCWVCGLVYEVGKWKSTLRWRCSAWQLARGEALKKGSKVLVKKSQRQTLVSWLQQQNDKPERCGLHWPKLSGDIDGEVGEKLENECLVCVKCGGTSAVSQKRYFMQTRCGTGGRKNLYKVSSLNRVDGEADRMKSEDAEGIEDDARGGLRASSFNIGALNDKVQLLALLTTSILLLQETCVVKAEWPSFASAFKAVGYSAVFGPVLPSDHRWRKGVPYARRGCGVAIAARLPWVALSAGHLYQDPLHEERAMGRLVSAIAVDPDFQVILHSVYLSYWDVLLETFKGKLLTWRLAAFFLGRDGLL